MQKTPFSYPKGIFGLLMFACVLAAHPAFSQTADSVQKVNRFSAAATVTNNGISLLPTFSLGKPAAIFDMTAGGKKLSFEPQLRFSLEGKPWSMIFWWRYKVVKTNKFLLQVGAHPALVFRETAMATNGLPDTVMVSRRYIATEVSPNYFVKKYVSIGMYYLYSHGLAAGTTGNTHFVTLNANFSNIRLNRQFYMKFFPQVYYLRMDDKAGFYATATVTLAHRKFPLSIQSILNQSIRTEITGKSFVWNLSLVYGFNREYVRKKS